MKQSRFPKRWDEEGIKPALEHYENQSEDEAVAEDEAAWENTSRTFVEVPNELVPVVLSKSVNDAIQESLAEDAEDLAAFEERAMEPLISYETMIKRLKKDGRI